MLTAHDRMANVITIEKSTVCMGGGWGDVFLFVCAAAPPVWFVFVSGLFLRSVGVAFCFFLFFSCVVACMPSCERGLLSSFPRIVFLWRDAGLT